MTDAIRVGVVGAGVMGTKHLAHIAEHSGARVYALAELIEGRRDDAAARFAPEVSYEQGVELINDERVDAVMLALPADGRFALAKHALEAGKHVFLEKPVARSVGEVDELLAVRKPEKKVAVASSRFTFLGSFKAVHAAVREAGGAASIYQIAHAGIKANPALPEVSPPDWRLSFEKNGGGIMSNWGCYDLNYLLAMLDWEAHITEVTASWRPVPEAISRWVADGSDAETHVSAYLRLSTGGVIMLDRGEYLPVPETFSATSIIGDTWSVNCGIIAEEGDEHTITRYDESGTSTRPIWTGGDDWNKVHRPVIHDFVDAIRDNRDPATTLEQARQIQEATDAIYASAREKRSITL